MDVASRSLLQQRNKIELNHPDHLTRKLSDQKRFSIQGKKKEQPSKPKLGLRHHNDLDSGLLFQCNVFI